MAAELEAEFKQRAALPERLIRSDYYISQTKTQENKMAGAQNVWHLRPRYFINIT